MRINVISNNNTTVFELNNSTAAGDLYSQLPLTISVENYSNNEKIFYPPKKLNTTDTPLANAQAGTLAYYAPWGDVVMFYGSFGSAAGLYELGRVVSGSGYIQKMSGTIRIEKNNHPIKISIKTGETILTATLIDNATTRALIAKLPLTLPMEDLFHREMCYHFSDELPIDNVQTTGYEVGEIIYWPPHHSLVIMYAQNGEKFRMQKIGRIDSGVDFFADTGDVTITLEV